MGNSLKECSQRLQELMATIEDGARECAHKLLGKTVGNVLLKYTQEFWMFLYDDIV